MRRIVVAVAMVALLPLSSVLAESGDPDPSFGTNGVATVHPGFDQNLTTGGIVVQPDGAIVVATRPTTGVHGYFGVARFQDDGTPDPTFGDEGFVSSDLDSPTSNARASDVVVQPNGKIVAVGSLGYYRYGMVVARLRPGGGFDPTFGDQGTSVTGVYSTSEGSDTDAFASAVALDETGRIVVAGAARIPSGGRSRFLVARLRSDGTMDDSFGDDPFNRGIVLTRPALGSSSASDLVVQSDGRLLVAGTAGGRVALVRYRAGGGLDRTFGDAGVVMGQPGTASSVALLPSGQILVGGTASVGGSAAMSVWRFRANGTPDATFGDGGHAIADLGADTDELATDLVVAPSGRTFIGGWSGPPGESGGDFAVARLDPSGDPDPAFGTAGWSVTDIGTQLDILTGLALQHDGKVLAAGYGSNALGQYLGLVRYDVATGQPDTAIARTGGEFVGEDIYGRSGVGQSRRLALARGASGSLTVRVGNDGTVPAQYTVDGCGSGGGLSLTYRSGAEDVTAAVVGDGYQTKTVDPRADVTIELEVTARQTADVGHRTACTVKAVSSVDGLESDAVLAVIEIVA